MASVASLRIYPVKGLDGISVEESTIVRGGTLTGDREYALFDSNGDVMNGKRTADIQTLSTDFEPETGTLAVQSPAGKNAQFQLREADERTRAGEWFSEYFETDLTMERDDSLGFVDRREMGPSVISTATLETVASWFDEMSVEGARRRMRANVEIAGVPAFWEDGFVGDNAPQFDAGSVRFEGVTPCGRCVVPERDPDTGEPIDGFREQFIRNREETFPKWVDETAFDHYYTVMLIASVPELYRKETLRVGDPVSVIESNTARS